MPIPSKHTWQIAILTGVSSAAIFSILSIAALLTPVTAQASSHLQATATPSPGPFPTFDPQRLEKPVIASDNSEQLKKGSLVYWGVCMACHGDRGQGLTTEWRAAFGAEDGNCWQAGCHGPDYPEKSFFMPKDKAIPAVAGPGKLARFSNAQELYDFVLARMPWWNPGQLTKEEAWQVSAYILSLQKVIPKGLELTDTNASAIRIQSAVPRPGNDRPAILILTGLLTLAGIGMIAQAYSQSCGQAYSHSSVQDLRKDKPRISERPNFFHHLHPPTIPLVQARLRYTLGAGGLAVFLCLILLVTGILEMFYYIPTPEHAAISVEVITSLVPFGALIRNLHFWSAQALMIVMSIHLLRVVLTGAYTDRRRSNYLIGLGMLVLVTLLDFTGYVLRWDEGIRWALIVGTNLIKAIPWMGDWLYQLVVGGSEPAFSTLERFYTWHIFVLTLAMIILGAWHIFRVRRDGGIAVPPPDQRQDPTRLSRFDLVRREVLGMVAAGVILLFVSAMFPAPIERPITQTVVDIQTARAPWFFLWVQQLLKLGDPFLWGVAAPIILLIILAVLPYILPQTSQNDLGRWFPPGNRLAQVIVIVIALILIILTIVFITPTTHL
ncbi:MAG TPA: cytochrome b N-terminal domain-containing protein [Anaerolineales bacterium]|nr:cytochrome b N-terminal domain-containing protein [Anaerolineales bacterium]